ncbi:carbohydrate kinase family protein [Streptomyces sp. NBC_01233]|uniref:carbohydrate kinase family protein n=1 Tax=Streptomyces sp. NBC_01233 TaxID=2903787 RepID=UPI002E13E3FC|nr:carbohydrate kinase [Streptomyces sp. NBC_01233]
MKPVTAPLLVMGEALTDLVPTNDGSGSYIPLPGGAPANVAAGLARLGIPVAFVGTLGDDRFGGQCEERLRKAGVTLDLCGHSDLPTAVAVASLTDAGTHYSFYVQDTATFRFPARTEGLDQFAAVYVGGLAAVLPQAADEVFATAQAAAQQSVLAVDPNVRAVRGLDEAQSRFRLRELCSLAQVIKVSDEDAAWLWPGEEPDRVCRRMADEGRLVVLTRGARGSSAFLPFEDRVSVESVPVSLVNTIGAGDAFMAAVLAQLARHGGLVDRDPASITHMQAAQLLRYGSLMAAWVCGRADADLPSSLSD